MRSLGRLLRIALVLVMVCGTTGVGASPALADTAGSGVNTANDPVVVVLDTSSSMSDTDSSGTERIVGARAAVLGLVDALPPKSKFALIAYPGGGRVVDGCSVGRVEIPLGELDQPTTAAAVRRLTPDGDTPTAPALQHAADLIKRSPTQRGTIVLVSDGESNCGSTDVCELARKLATDGVEVRVNTVGFQISDEGAGELTCIANSTGGRYVDAENKDDLARAIQDLSGAHLVLTASVPNPLPVVSGTGTDGPKAILAVTNSGRKQATDVRASLDFRDRDNRPGALLVPRPVQYLGNLDPGQTRQVEVTVRPDAAQVGAQFNWTAVTTATNAAPARQQGTTRTGEPGLDGLLAGVHHLAVLGDSYSSGEGAGDYSPDTAGGEGNNACHRSSHAYGRVLSENATLIACSGAVTADFYDQQESGGKKIEPQLKALRALALSNDSPDAVLLSIGGNDVDFSGKVTTCLFGVAGQTCAWDGPLEENQFRSDAAAQVAGIADSLRRVYRDVNRAVNDGTARGKRNGRYAPIVVVPYPRILPSDAAGAAAAGGCQFAINAGEVQFFNDFIDMLNLEIMAAVGSLRSQHIPVYVVSEVVSAFQPNHTICDAAGSYANFFANPLDLNHQLNVLGVQKQELMHPNAAGNQAMARAISVWSASKTMMTDPATVTWSSNEVRRLNPIANAVAHVIANPVDLYLAGGDAQIDAKGFAPSSTVIFRLDSAPRVVGRATADPDGSIRATVALPADIRPGQHHLHAMGLTADGAPHDVVVPVRLLPFHSIGAIVAVAAGLVGIAVGAAGHRRSRRG